MTPALWQAIHALHGAYDVFASLFPHVGWVIGAWGLGGLAMDYVQTAPSEHL